ncbi:MAG TPA: CpsD/CapB family tyrosine-protein kinase [Vicinamibacterales bacterium]|nr:CpsD/CapB family tyrosine-protein kinase [Vicinamibacterales bacterium]
MSRIDEALRRALGTPGDTAGAAPAERGARAGSLDDYPREAPASDQPRAGLSVVRPVPAPPAGKRARASAAAGDGKLVVAGGVSPLFAEQYRRLAAALYQLQANAGLKTVLVSSAVPGEGKTLTATNLALTLAESYGQRVLLVDADLRDPTVHHLLGLPGAPGLAEYLRAEAAELPIAAASSTLSLVPAGTPNGNPVAGLVSERMRGLVRQAVGRFDWVLLDTPPVGLLPDANLVARLADGVLFVIAAGATPYRLVQRAIAAVEPERVIGVVLNRADQEVLPTRYYRETLATGSRREP